MLELDPKLKKKLLSAAMIIVGILVSGSAYISGVMQSLPDSGIVLFGPQIAQAFFSLAFWDLAISAMLARLLYLLILGLYLYVVRIPMSLVSVLSKISPWKKKGYRLVVRFRRWADLLYTLIAASPLETSLLLSILIFPHFHFESTAGFRSLIAIFVLCLGGAGTVHNLNTDKLRIRFRYLNLIRRVEGLLLFSTISAVLLFLNFSGGAKFEEMVAADGDTVIAGRVESFTFLSADIESGQAIMTSTGNNKSLVIFREGELYATLELP